MIFTTPKAAPREETTGQALINKRPRQNVETDKCTRPSPLKTNKLKGVKKSNKSKNNNYRDLKKKYLHRKAFKIKKISKINKQEKPHKIR